MLVIGGAAILAGTVLAFWARPSDTPYRPLAGSGHGRGMSQVGAFDSALDGWAAERILDHYYPGATLGTIPATTVAVRLLAQDDSTLDTFADAGVRVAGQVLAPGQVAHLTALPDGGANVVVTVGCDGEVLWQTSTSDPWVYPVNPLPNRPAAEHLKLCGGSGYRGALGVAMEGGAARTVNRVDVDDYLLGVVPAEVQANWADKGAAEALRAQAIAARSYALAEHRYPYAQTCDTTDCQAYPGTDKEDPRAGAAVAATAGTVLLRDGRILRSEYSSAPDGGQPADIYTFDVGPTPAELGAPAVGAGAGSPAAPADPRRQVGVAESAIAAEYRRLGGPNSTVGQPIGPEMALPQNAGTYRLFTNGVIIATATLGAQVVDFTTLMQLVPDPPGATSPRGQLPSTGGVPGGSPEGVAPQGSSDLTGGVAPRGGAVAPSGAAAPGGAISPGGAPQVSAGAPGAGDAVPQGDAGAPAGVVPPDNAVSPENALTPEGDYLPEDAAWPEASIAPEIAISPESAATPGNPASPGGSLPPGNTVAPNTASTPTPPPPRGSSVPFGRPTAAR